MLMGKPIIALISPRTISLCGGAARHSASVHEAYPGVPRTAGGGVRGPTARAERVRVTLMSEGNELLSIVFISATETTTRAKCGARGIN